VPYPTLSDYKLFKSVTSDVDNARMTRDLAAAISTVEDHCLRTFLALGAGTLYYGGVYDRPYRRWLVVVDDFTGDATVTVAGAEVTHTKLPLNAASDGVPFTVIELGQGVTLTGARGEVTVEADTWGWPSVPDAVAEAIMFQASRFSFRKDSPMGIAGSPEQGSELRLLSRVDPDVAVALKRFRRPGKVG